MNEHLHILPRHTPLGQAVDLYTLQTHRFKTARLTLSLAMPADEREAMLDTLLFGVMRRGSEQYPSLAALNRRLDELYGTTLTVRSYLHGDTHVMAFTAELLEDAFLTPDDQGRLHLLRGVMELFSQLLLHPLTDEHQGLRPTAVAAEKTALADSLCAEINDPRTYAAIRFRRLMCEGEPYGISLGGSPETVDTASVSEVTEAWRRMTEKAACTLFYVGRAEAETVKAAYDAAFAEWDPAPLGLPSTIRHTAPATPRRVEEERPVSQGRLCMGWSDHGERDTAAMAVLNEMLGAMQGALLFRHVREALGLCYECDSAYDAEKGILTVTCGIHPDRRDEAEAAVNRVLDTLRRGEISSEDVAQAITSLTHGYVQMNDSPASMESFFLRGVMNDTLVAPAHRVAELQGVTAEDVARAAKALIPDTVYFLKGTRPEADGEEEYE